jgi:hypothetical protein
MKDLLLSYIAQNQGMTAFLAMKQLYEDATGDVLAMEDETIMLAGQACFQGRDPEAMLYWLEEFAQMLPQQELLALLSDPQAATTAAIQATRTTPEKQAAIQEAEQRALAETEKAHKERIESGDPEALQDELFHRLFDGVSSLKAKAQSPQERQFLNGMTDRLFKARGIEDLQTIEAELMQAYQM